MLVDSQQPKDGVKLEHTIHTVHGHTWGIATTTDG